MTESYDLVLVGGGLQSALVALAAASARPGTRIAIVERGATLGGNHTWCFHARDLSPRAARWIAPLVAHQWAGHAVAFPRMWRALASSYAAIPSDRVDGVVRALPGVTVLDRTAAEDVVPGAVAVRDARGPGVISGRLVVDARGPERAAPVACGWQKFVGLELVTAAPHGLERPVLMDTCVPQVDGARFFYVLPLAPDRLLVEDTYYSDGAHLDVAAIRAEVLAYAEARGWRGEVVRTETGVLPLPFEPEVVAPRPGLVVGGYQGGWLHPVTGYSLPIAARLADAIADGLATADPLAPVMAAAEAHRAQLAFAGRLVRMMFRWFDPADRTAVFEHFYRLPEDVIGRFYALALTRRDRARFFVGRPPRGLSWRAVLSGTRTKEAT